MNWLLDKIWHRVIKKYFYFQAATIAFQAVLGRPYDTTKEQDIEVALGYAEDFMRAAVKRFNKLEEKETVPDA